MGIENIQWTPEIREGIISIGVLDSLGWTGYIKDGKYYLRDEKNNLRILGKKYNGIYYAERIFPAFENELNTNLMHKVPAILKAFYVKILKSIML